MQQNYNPNECQAAPVPQPVAQGQAPNNYGTYQQPAPAPAPAPQYYQQPAPAGQPVNNYGYGAPAGSPQPVQGQVQETQYTGYGTGGVVASHGTGNVVTGTGSLKGFAAGMNKLATGVALAFGNASGGRVVTPGGVAVAGNVPAGDGVCHFNQCRFFMKTGYCSGGHTLQCQDMNCAFYHHWVDPGHVHQAKPMQQVVVGQPVIAPQPQAGSPQVLQTVPGTTTVPLGSGTQNGHLHGSGTVTLGSYGTGTAVVGAAPINDLAYTMNRAVTGVALAAGPASGGAVVSPSGAVVQGGDIPCGTGECHYNQCKFFMKSGYCVSGHTVQCRNQACPFFLQYCPPGHVCTQK